MMAPNTNKKIKVQTWIVAVLMFLLFYPYFAWPLASYYLWIVNIPLIFILLTNQAYDKDSRFAVFFLLLCLLAALCSGQNVFGIISMTCLPLIFTTSKRFLIETYSKFRLIYVVLILLSLISYFLINFLGVHLPSHTVPPPPGNTLDCNFIVYPFYVVPDTIYVKIFSNLRFHGIFDEPGAVGTTAFLILLIEKFNLRHKGNIIILLSGIFSFSLFFYITVFTYMAFKFFVNFRISIKSVLIMIVTIMALFFVMTNEITSELIGERLAWNEEEKTIVGDDRSGDDLKNYVKKIRGTEAYFWGVRDNTIKSEFEASASLEKVVVSYGIVVVILYFVFYYLFALHHLRLKKEFFLFALLFVAIMYNRPTLFAYQRLFLLNIAILSLSNKYQLFFEKESSLFYKNS